MFSIYSFLTKLLSFFAAHYLKYRISKNKEHKTRYKEKLGIIDSSRENGFLIWFHAASVGEAMSILPIVEKLEKESSISKILITTVTLSSSKILEKKLIESKKILHQFLPLDMPIFIDKFLNHWSPNLSIFVDSEIWPNFIYKIKERKIPLILINGRITKKSFTRWKLLKKFSKKLFEKFDLCLASNDETEGYLKILGAKQIKNLGNLKFAFKKSNINNKLNSNFLDKIKNKKIWCASSTHPSEEIFCSKVHLKLKKKFTNVLTIIIPRHVDRIQSIIKDLSNLNIKICLYSKFEEINKDTDLLLVDAYGETSKFYEISKSVFLGKSIVQTLIENSGQNPIEASRYGCKIYHGPNVKNFFEIYQYLESLSISKKILNSEELYQFIAKDFDTSIPVDDKILEEIGNRGENILNNVIKEIKQYLI